MTKPSPAGPPPDGSRDGEGEVLPVQPPSDSVVAVIRELKLSGLNNLEDLIRDSIEASQYAVRGRDATTAVRAARSKHWTFVSPEYVYEGGSGEPTTQSMW